MKTVAFSGNGSSAELIGEHAFDAMVRKPASLEKLMSALSDITSKAKAPQDHKEGALAAV